MTPFSEAIRRARSGAAERNPQAVVRALEPHVEALHRGVHLGALLDLAWALGAMGRCEDAQALLSAVPRRDPTVRLELTLARAGWF